VSAPPYRLTPAPEYNEVIAKLKRKPGENATKLKKINKTLGLLRDHGPGHPSLNAHKYDSMPEVIPGKPVWEVYVENNTPNAWRLFYCHGPEADMLTIITVWPHP